MDVFILHCTIGREKKSTWLNYRAAIIPTHRDEKMRIYDNVFIWSAIPPKSHAQPYRGRMNTPHPHTLLYELFAIF